ncbi:MAG: MFS transporter [Candidatus Promineifilaceae bacterium]
MQRSTRTKPILRWLLQLDKPVPVRTDAEVSAERDQNYNWNFAVNLADVSSFWFGLSFISFATVVPLFISKLTDSPIAIGVAALIAQGSWFLPQVFTANSIERLARKKPVIVNLGFFTERLPMWLIVLSAVIAARNPTLALIVFMVGYAWNGFGAGLVATAWQDLIARCFPVQRRGRFMGISFFVGALIGSLAAVFSVRLLAGFEYPLNFVISFFLAALFITFSWFALSLTREPVQKVSAPKKSSRQFWSELPAIVRLDENFRHFLVARLLLALSGMGITFVTVAAIRRWEVADGTVGIYTAVFLAGQMVGNLFLGLLADRHGHKLSLEIGALVTFLAFGLAWLAPSADWYFLVFFLLGIMQGAVIVSGILVVMEFSPAEKRPTYAGLTNTSVGVVSMIGPLFGAWLALNGYSLLFGLSAVIALISFAALHWWVQEPRFRVGPKNDDESEVEL